MNEEETSIVNVGKSKQGAEEIVERIKKVKELADAYNEVADAINKALEYERKNGYSDPRLDTAIDDAMKKRERIAGELGELTKDELDVVQQGMEKATTNIINHENQAFNK